MTIRKGEPWGSDAARPQNLTIASSDAELAHLIDEGISEPVGLTGGDLHRALGSPTPRDDMQLLPIDVLDVRLDGERALAVAHVVARNSWWRGRIVAACNVQSVGEWDVAPRAHPNDGKFDVVEVDPAMTVRERWQASRRLGTGTHVPHPRITSRTATERSWEFERPYSIRIDGRLVGNTRTLTVVVRPDAAEVLV